MMYGLILTGICFVVAMCLSLSRVFPTNNSGPGPWAQAPQYLLLALGGVLAWPAILELAYLGSPRTLRCCIGALLHATAGVGSLLGVAASSIASAFSATECSAVHTRLSVEFAIMAVSAWLASYAFFRLAERYKNPHPIERISVSWQQ
jgi:hypothetical protein